MMLNRCFPILFPPASNCVVIIKILTHSQTSLSFHHALLCYSSAVMVTGARGLDRSELRRSPILRTTQGGLDNAGSKLLR
jgi:hypothetical protein